MEDSKTNSFYDFLMANSQASGQEKENKAPIKQSHIVLSWLVIFFVNVIVLYFGWNYAVSPVFKLPLLKFYETLFIYAVVKVLTRGLFSVQ